MAGTSEPIDAPPPRVLERAARDELGEFELRMHRRPGFGGALACLVILVVVANFLVNSSDTVWGRAVVALGLVIVVAWGYVWIQRVRGGLYLFTAAARPRRTR